MHFDLKDYPLKSRYKLMTGTIVPRPIAWVSTISQSGRPNLAPFSYFTAVCEDPFTLAFCPGIRVINMSEKDTLRNIRATGEFVVNLVSEEVAVAMNITATELPPDVNEFERAGLTAVPSVRVRPPRVAESKVNYECRLVTIVDMGHQPGAGSIVIGEVLHAHVADEIIYGQDKIDIHKFKPIGRLSGFNYCRMTDLFEMQRLPAEIAPLSEHPKEMWQ